jgi:hypothetical protein
LAERPASAIFPNRPFPDPCRGDRDDRHHPSNRGSRHHARRAVGGGAEAQTSLGWGTLSGYAEYEHLFSGSNDDGYFNADLSFSTSPDGAGSGPALGFDAALRAFHDGDEFYHALYAALTYSTDFGKFSAGVPRPVVADMVRFPPIGGIRTLDVELSPIFGSFVEFAYLGDDGNRPLGLRYDGRFGGATVGISYHNIDVPGDNVEAFDIGLRYDFGGFGVLAAAEHVNVPGQRDLTNWFLGADGEFSIDTASIRAGLTWVGSDSIGGDLDGIRANVTYMPTDQIDLTGSLASIDGDQLYGIEMKYRFYRGAYMTLGAADGDGLDTAYDVSLGWQF